MLDITTVVQIAAIAVLALAAVGFIDWLYRIKLDALRPFEQPPCRG